MTKDNHDLHLCPQGGLCGASSASSHAHRFISGVGLRLHKIFRQSTRENAGVSHRGHKSLQRGTATSLTHIQNIDYAYRPLSRRLDRCDCLIQNESRDPFSGNVYYVTMQITFLTRKFRNGERNLHCDVVHITTKWVSTHTIDCNGVFAIKAYSVLFLLGLQCLGNQH